MSAKRIWPLLRSTQARLFADHPMANDYISRPIESAARVIPSQQQRRARKYILRFNGNSPTAPRQYILQENRIPSAPYTHIISSYSAAFCDCERIGVVTFAFVSSKAFVWNSQTARKSRTNSRHHSSRRTASVCLVRPFLGRICGGNFATVAIEERFKYQQPSTVALYRGSFQRSR